VEIPSSTHELSVRTVLASSLLAGKKKRSNCCLHRYLRQQCQQVALKQSTK
jgi:hypothetical protein